VKIEPKYVTFEQAKWVKEKGFNIPTLTFYLDGKPMFNHNKEPRNSNILPGNIDVARPEQWQVVECLRLNHGIWIYCKYQKRGKIIFVIEDLQGNNITISPDLNSPQEAYSAAFDYIKDNNLI
jgi:hypothetical protein